MGKTEEILVLVSFNLFFLLFILSYVLFFRQYILKKKEYENKLALQKLEHKKELLDTQVEIQLQTMQHIGREIHDNLGQKLTLASLYTQSILFENKDNKNFKPESLDKISNVISESLTTLRELSKSLTDDRIEKLSIIELISNELYKIKQLQEYETSLDYKQEIALNYQQKVVLLRITQEFIQNSIKHAQCNTIEISLLEKNNIVFLHLKDNGKGFDGKGLKANGIGLKNMKKRTELLGGTFNLNSSEKGTLIEINIPI